MANVIEDTENVLILTLLLVLVGCGIWAIHEVPAFKAWLRGLFKITDTGIAQSAKNALNGFPQGADPGTIPAAQIVQGIVESVRNLFYVDDGSPDPGSATAQEQQTDLNNWELPAANQAQQQVQQAVQQSDTDWNDIQTNPGLALQQLGIF